MLGIMGAMNEVLSNGDTKNEKYPGPLECVTMPITITGDTIRIVFYSCPYYPLHSNKFDNHFWHHITYNSLARYKPKEREL